MPTRKDEDLLKDINDRYKYASEQWHDVQEEGAKDMRAIAGDVWDPDDRAARKKAGRPCLSLDELNQYVNQLINEVRQHKRAIQVTAVGRGADEYSARIRAGLIRQIEYRSNAQQAYTTMFENTVQRSYGFLRVKPQFVSDAVTVGDGQFDPSAFDQELLIEPIVNPDLVLIDPDIQKPDGSDMQWAFICEPYTHDEFRRRWPKAKIQDFGPADIKARAPLFVKERIVLVAEYWCKELVRERELLLFHTTAGPMAAFADELETRPSDAQIVKSRKVPEYAVKQYLTNGLELLETTKFPGEDIPIVCCFGKVLYLNDRGMVKRIILSMPRLARDPAMLYCYYRTAEAEVVAMSTKFPYFVRKGSLSPESMQALAKSNHEPVAAIEVETTAEGLLPGTPPEMPVRNFFEPALERYEIGAEGARRAIQAAIGQTPLPTMAQRRNEKSGIALKQIEETGQKGSYHFIDHYEASVMRTGQLLNNLLPYYYDTPRDVAIRNEKDDASMIRINDPQAPDQKTQQVPMIAAGQHDVTLSTGPSYDSEREIASEFVDVLVGQIERVANVAGPDVAKKVFALGVKLKNIGAIGDEIADAISPPESEGQPQIPPEVQQHIQQLEQQNQELQPLADKNRTDLMKAQMDAQVQQAQQQADDARAAAERESKERIELRKLEVELEIEMAKLGSAESMARAQIEQQDLHQHGQEQLAREQMDAQQAQADLDRQATHDQQAAEGTAAE